MKLKVESLRKYVERELMTRHKAAERERAAALRNHEQTLLGIRRQREDLVEALRDLANALEQDETGDVGFQDWRNLLHDHGVIGAGSRSSWSQDYDLSRLLQKPRPPSPLPKHEDASLEGLLKLLEVTEDEYVGSSTLERLGWAKLAPLFVAAAREEQSSGEAPG